MGYNALPHALRKDSDGAVTTGGLKRLSDLVYMNKPLKEGS